MLQGMRERLERIELELRKVLPDRIDRQWAADVSADAVSVPEVSYYQELAEPAIDLVRRGGKRWRPLLMVLVAEALCGSEAAERAYPLVPVVELPHTGSLIIDDIEDSAEMRRGKEAAHIRYGLDISINAGNLLYYLPTICIDNADLPVGTKLELYRIYAKYLRRVHLGQGLDIVWHRTPELFPLQEEYLQMCRFKTGCLAGMSAELGGAAAGADPSVRKTLGSIAETVGVGFQIRDDIQNLTVGNPGKRRGDDIIEGKKSLPIIMHLERRPDDKKVVAELFCRARDRDAGAAQVTAAIEDVIARITDSGAIAEAAALGEMYMEKALNGLQQIPQIKDSRARSLLFQLVRDFSAAHQV